MRRKYIFLLIGWLITIASFAAVPDKKPEKVLPVQEKVYLHFDNNCYFLGDTIWYKAYVVLADDNSPEPLSRILYVELLNEQGYLMERQQLEINKLGQADGCFAICDTLFAGFYEVRAYTKWMLNFGYDYTRHWYDWHGHKHEDFGWGKRDLNGSQYSGDYADVLADLENQENYWKYADIIKRAAIISFICQSNP